MSNVDLISLRKTYPGTAKPVLDKFSLKINSGELVSLLGPSGSGKSTLLKLISGIENPDEGDIRIAGKSILAIPPNKRGAVMMFQKAYLLPFYNVAENIGFGLKIQGSSAETIKTEVKKMLDLIGLPGIERRKVSNLSGGEQQRVSLARALIVQPQLLLLDEPLSSLDTAIRLNLQESIRRIQRELGITSILVTHDLNEAMGMSDRMALLLDGKAAAVDEPMRLFQNPPTEKTARFVGISTFLKGRLEKEHLITEKGEFVVNSNGHASTPTEFAIRPEHIQVILEQSRNSMPGIVTDCMYRGEYIEYQVAIKGGDVVRAHVPMPARMIPSNNQVYVVFPQEHLFQISDR